MAQGATDLGKHDATTRARWSLGSRLRRRQESHEARELDHVADRIRRGRRVEMRVIFRGRIEQAAARLVAFRREELVRHTLFDVVRLPGEDHEGLVLRLPTKPGDTTIVRTRIDATRPLAIGPSENAHRAPARTLR